MLKTLRRQMKGILWIVIVGVGVSFLFWGTGRGRRSPKQQFIAEIYGNKIPVNQYLKSLRWAQTMAQLRYGDQFRDVEKFLNLEEEALQDLVLLEYARLNNVIASDYELRSLIASFPVFHNKDGAFDPEVYQALLRNYFGMNPEYFENGMRDSLRISKLRDSITDQVKVTEQELRQYHRYLNEKVKVRYILFRPSDFESEVHITQQQIRDHFEANPDQFSQPEKVKMEYVFFEPKPQDMLVSELEIKDYYQQNQDRFKDPKRKDKLLPLNKVRDNISQEIKTRKAMKKAGEEGEQLLSSLEQGIKTWKDLEVIQTDYLEKKEYPDNLPPPCIERAFAMRLSEITDLVQTEDGFFIIKLVDRQVSQPPSTYQDVADRVRGKIMQVESSKLAQSTATNCLARLSEKKKIQSVAREYAKTIADTDFFSRVGSVNELGTAFEFIRTAFSLTTENPFAQAVAPPGFCVLMLQQRKGADEDNFREEQENLKNVFLSEKKKAIFADWTQSLRQQAQISFARDTDPSE